MQSLKRERRDSDTGVQTLQCLQTDTGSVRALGLAVLCLRGAAYII